MFLAAFFFFLSLAAAEDSCPQLYLHNFYREVGCEPRFEKGFACPTSYDCSKFESRNQEQCHNGDKSYNINDEVNDIPGDSCLASCRCDDLDVKKKGNFRCAQVECPEHFSGRTPGTRYLYEEGRCCSISKTTAPAEEAPVTCVYDNQTYIGGEKFYPTKSDNEPCKVCICKEKFEGKIEAPFCQTIRCNFQLRNTPRIAEGCVPIFYQGSCCPIDWRCPEPTDEIKKQRTKILARTDQTCKFGNLTLQPEERLNSEDKDELCSCKTPPYVTCVKRPSQSP